MSKIILLILPAFCLLLSFCNETNPVSQSHNGGNDTSILIGTWAQKFDTSTAERKEYWRAFPGTNLFNDPDTTEFKNDSIEVDFYFDQTGKRYKDTLYYYYKTDTLFTYTRPDTTSGIQIEADTSWCTFRISKSKDTLIFGDDTIGCLYKLN